MTPPTTTAADVIRPGAVHTPSASRAWIASAYGRTFTHRSRRVSVGAAPRFSVRLTVFGCTPTWAAMSRR